VARIFTNRKSGFIQRGGRMRRESVWAFANPTRTVLSAASNATLIGTFNAAALALRPFTIVRTRGLIHLKSDQTAALEDFDASVGYAVVSDQAAAIGITAVPTPETDRGSDLFFVYESLAGSFIFVSGVGFHPIGGVWKDFDSKAMRRVDDDSDLALTIETSAISNGVTFTHGSRLLLKLH